MKIDEDLKEVVQPMLVIIGIVAVVVFPEHLNCLALTVNDHQTRLITTVDTLDGAIFIGKDSVRRIKRHLIIGEFEFELR